MTLTEMTVLIFIALADGELSAKLPAAPWTTWRRSNPV